MTVLLGVVLSLCTPGPATAQLRSELGFPRAEETAAPGWMTTPAGAFGASLLVPGLGQAALGLSRWVVYVAAEAGFWAFRLDAKGDERRFRSVYRDLAWEVARIRTDAERQDGGWGYYEAMSRYLASGAFDRDPALPGIQPETDPATYNGAVWEVARGTYLPGGAGEPGSPEYELALGYYRERAAGPDFLWSWLGQEPELDRFRGFIGRADDERRRATLALGLVLANHAVAAVDAVVVARLRADTDLHLRSGADATGGALRWRVSLELSTPW